MKITATTTVTVERADGSASTTIETFTEQVPDESSYTLRDRVRSTATETLGRVLDRVEAPHA